MNLFDLQSAVDQLKQLGVPDDCMWMNTVSLENLKELMCVRVRVEPHCDFAGIKIFVDDSVIDHIVESGTYKVVDGCVRKVVNQRFLI